MNGGERRYNKDQGVSKKNREHITDFMKSYHVADSTKSKFYDFIRYFLHETKDAKEAMLSRKTMASIFNNIHKGIGVNGYVTTLGVTKRFLKWLNNGIEPPSMSRDNIKQITKNEKLQLKRVNRSDYKTLSWDDGVKISEQTNSIQLKAMPLVALEGGLRPGEFVRLNYDDCKRDGKFIILNIRETKTGKPRQVVLYKSSPALNRWLQMHPLKGNNPLWVYENRLKSSTYRDNGVSLRYTQDAIRKSLKRLAILAGIKKHISGYMLRHSSISISKEVDKLNPEMGAEKYGHSIKFYIETYGLMSDKAKVKRFKEVYGEGKEKVTDKQKSHVCPVCNSINEADKDFCVDCHSALTLKAALEEKERTKTDMLKGIIELIKEDPETLRKALQIKAEVK
jgi:integrase